MATKVSALSNLIHRAVSSSCLNHPLSHYHTYHVTQNQNEEDQQQQQEEDDREEPEVEEEAATAAKPAAEQKSEDLGVPMEMHILMEEVFEAVTAVKKAYISLQNAHSPWDPHRIRSADESVVAELRKLSRLKDRYRRRRFTAAGGSNAHPPLREAVAPYEAALFDVRRELKVKEAEVESLKEKLKSVTTSPVTGKKGRFRSARKTPSLSSLAVPAIPTPELFDSCVDQMKSSTKSFTKHLISLMRSSRLDISTAVKSIMTTSSEVGSHHARHAVESYVNHKLFQGFENESFYLEGTLSSLLNPNHHRTQCFAQFRDMRAMDPSELLGVLPTCRFGKWAAKKYLSIMDSNLEEMVMGSSDQRRTVAAGEHPRTCFYGDFLRMAKAVWMLHLLTFAMDPTPNHFEATGGSEFQQEYMESVVRFPGDRVPGGWIVGFGVGPGFRLGNKSVVRARVYPVPPGRDADQDIY